MDIEKLLKKINRLAKLYVAMINKANGSHNDRLKARASRALNRLNEISLAKAIILEMKVEILEKHISNRRSYGKAQGY